MSEYIERQKALDTVFRSHSVEAAHKFLAAIKPADVRPVVRGKWTCHRTLEHDGDWWCTACGNELTIYMGNRPDRYKFCPNCGARMEES